jgi:NADH-quinone oxidoreductase subunit B
MIEGVMKEGFVTTSYDAVVNWAKTGSIWPMTFGLACCAVEMMHAAAARYDMAASVRSVPSQPAPVRPDDCGRHAVQQDGAGAAQGLRPDVRAALGLSMGSCANGGGYYHYSYSVVRGCDRIVPSTSMCRAARRRPKR